MTDSVARVITCPQCSASLTPEKFARSVKCGSCGAAVQIDPSFVAAAAFRKALADQNAPAQGAWMIGGSQWIPLALLGRGDRTEVHLVERAGLPTERGVLKLGAEEREWDVLQQLQKSQVSGADLFTTIVPQPILRGTVSGRPAMIVRWRPGFRHTLEAVRAVHREGLDPRIAVWIWRRTLEVLAFLHRSRIVHGAVHPKHLLIEDGDHGIHLVGYGAADIARPSAIGEDIAMSAKSIAFAVGDGQIPGAFSALIKDASAGRAEDALELHARVGEVARSVFGPPSFNPVIMP